ncbi:dethiobiotin synthase [Shewanella waksmanii]|uniref:dethiobiotin synthase n=1 Tax=Shewanella waksmanii TaxID=213783 RepID=UPI00373621E6
MVYFIAGTDTDCGKTLVASALLYRFSELGSTLGVKPIASGCEHTPSGLRNSDALSLIAHANIALDYQIINPIAFEPAIAPHIAAKQQGLALTCDVIHQALAKVPFEGVDFGLVEGAGGWRLPLGQGEYLSQVVVQQQYPVILVVGLKLGCLNHALLTQEALQADGVEIAGWVGNLVDPHMSCLEENIDSLHQMMSAPCLGIIPHVPGGNVYQAATYLDISALQTNFEN